MRTFVWLTAASVLVAGCLVAPPDDGSPAAAAGQAPTIDAAYDASYVVAANLTVMHWRGPVLAEGGAISLGIDFADGATCDLYYTSAGPGGLADFKHTTLIEGDGVRWVSQFKSRPVAGAQVAGVVDSRGDAESDTAFVGRRLAEPLEGIVTFTWVGERLQDAGGYPAAGLDVTCDRPFDLLGASMGSAASFFKVDRMDSETSVVVGWTAAVVQGASWSSESVDTFSRLFVEYQADDADIQFVADVTTPQTRDAWSSGEWHEYTDGPGQYAVEINGVGEVDLWGAFYGLDAYVDPSDFIADEQVVDWPS